MIVRLAILGLVLATAGCVREPERSRVVPSAESVRTPAAAPAGGRETHKIEMH